MSQFPVEPAAKYIFGFHLTYPFLHCGLLFPVCLRDFISQICWLFYVCLFFCKKCSVVTLAIYTWVILPPKMWKVSDKEQPYFLPLGYPIVNEM